MTHNEIYTKFMIEYDKANVTSSYPSLTKYEVFTILDKAYNALIAQKVTGNNARRVPLEGDVKSVSDLQGLITTKEVKTNILVFPKNMYSGKLPADFLYYVSAKIKSDWVPIKLLPHQAAQKFFVNIHNKPWVKTPVCYIEGGNINLLKDPEELSNGVTIIDLSYVRTPVSFLYGHDHNESDQCIFECGDTMAEELISLAITFALENVESPRLNTKLNTRGLEA